jgi:hypothetical protein
MKYDVLITEIINESSRKVLAHQLARDPGVSFQDALDKLQKLPVVLFKDIDENAMTMYVGQYHKYGVRLKAVPAQNHAGIEAQPQDISPKPSDVPGPESQPGERKKNLQIHQNADDKILKVLAPLYPTTEVVKKKKKVKRNDLVVLAALLIGILFLFVILLIGSFNKKRALKIVTIENEKTDTTGAKLLNSEDKHREQNEDAKSTANKRKDVSVADMKRSVEMCDSAQMIKNDILKLINFYKIAISFNKYNYDAWFGLLAAYKSAEMNKEYKETYNEIKKLFGDGVFDITSLVSRLGIIEDIYENEDGVLIIKYSTGNGAIEKIEEDTYSLVKALHSNYNYQSLSIVVSDKKKERMVVHIRPGMEISSFADFKKNASLTVFDK